MGGAIIPLPHVLWQSQGLYYGSAYQVMICWGFECYTLMDGYPCIPRRWRQQGFLKKLVHTFQTAWHDTPEDRSCTRTKMLNWMSSYQEVHIYKPFLCKQSETSMYIIYLSTKKTSLYSKLCLSMTDCMSIVHIVCVWIIQCADFACIF